MIARFGIFFVQQITKPLCDWLAISNHSLKHRCNEAHAIEVHNNNSLWMQKTAIDSDGFMKSIAPCLGVLVSANGVLSEEKCYERVVVLINHWQTPAYRTDARVFTRQLRFVTTITFGPKGGVKNFESTYRIYGLRILLRGADLFIGSPRKCSAVIG